MRLIEIIGLVGLVISLNSCKTNRHSSINPYSQGCTIKGQYGKKNSYDISEYLKNIKQEVNAKVNLSNNVNEILITEEVNGGDGISEMRILYFNEEEIIPVKVIYHHVNGIAKTKEIEIENISNKKRNKLLMLFKESKEYGEWNLCVKCYSATIEQKMIFYIKDGDNYLYFAEFENFYFSKNPSIGIDENILEIVDIIESMN